VNILRTALAQQPVTLVHVHGLAYSGDGRQLMIPSHHGLAVYRDGKWSKAPGPQHDYMGFVAAARQLYSSGHPAPGSGLVNPFGLIRSRDGGRTWDKLGLEGETDFHVLAAGWNSNAIYVWNSAPSSRMPRAGLHLTLNDGLVWRRAMASGLPGVPRALAVHPDDPAIVAAAAPGGLFVSRDSGERFTKFAGGEGLALHVDLNGREIWYGAFEGRPTLARVLLTGEKSVGVSLPPLAQDAVAYLAQNPVRRAEYAIATFERSVYLSRDDGKTWSRIAHRGEAR
jgi:photosystem II stability/assembly factor-like uncharacterized protein